MRKVVLCILGTLTINCGPKVDGDRDSRGGTRIGPAGGVVEGPNGARIEIPEGALSEEVEIGIRLANSSDLEGVNWSALETEVDEANRTVTAEVASFSFFQPGATAPEEDDGVEEAGDAYEVTPHGQRFNVPVRVRVPYRSRVAGLGLFQNTVTQKQQHDEDEDKIEQEKKPEVVVVRGNLMWQHPRNRPTSNSSSCTGADRYCAQLTLEDYSDWRVPTIDELQSLHTTDCQRAIESSTSCCHDPFFAPGCACACWQYWSSTEVRTGNCAKEPGCRYIMRFSYLDLDDAISVDPCRNNINPVRCVRTIQ